MSCTHEWRIEYVPVDACQKCRARQEEVEAYRRGAEVMREACVDVVRTELSDPWYSDELLEPMRALPIPEDKP